MTISHESVIFYVMMKANIAQDVGCVMASILHYSQSSFGPKNMKCALKHDADACLFPEISNFYSLHESKSLLISDVR